MGKDKWVNEPRKAEDDLNLEKNPPPGYASVEELGPRPPRRAPRQAPFWFALIINLMVWATFIAVGYFLGKASVTFEEIGRIDAAIELCRAAAEGLR
jgi:hypothetical protein